MILALLVIAGLLLLPSCSSSPKPADKPQAKTECDEVKKIYDDFGGALDKEPRTTDTYRLLYLTKNYYLLENPKCFTSIQIAAARAAVTIATR
jgi:hypothetical protein